MFSVMLLSKGAKSTPLCPQLSFSVRQQEPFIENLKGEPK